MVITLSIFNSSGKVPVSIQLLKISVNDAPVMELPNSEVYKELCPIPWLSFHQADLVAHTQL